MDRIPFQATTGGAQYDGLGVLPVAVLLDNVRSMYNVGAFFRTADAASIEKLYLCGITARPPKKAIAKTALGAEDTVPWEHAWDALPLVEGDEKMVVIPATAGIEQIITALAHYETVVLLKVKPVFSEIIALLRATGREQSTVFVERVGSPRQKVLTDFEEIAAHSPDYLSLMIIK